MFWVSVFSVVEVIFVENDVVFYKIDFFFLSQNRV